MTVSSTHKGMILLLVLVAPAGAVPAAASPDHPSATFFSEFAALVGGHRVDPGFRIQDLTVSVRLRSGDRSVRVDYHFLGEVVAERVADVTNWAFLPPERLLGVVHLLPGGRPAVGRAWL